MAFSRSVRPKNTLPLLTSTVKMDADEPAVRCRRPQPCQALPPQPPG